LYSDYIYNSLLDISPYKKYLILYYNIDHEYESRLDNLTYYNLYDDDLNKLYDGESDDYKKYDTIFCSNLLTIYDDPLYILNIIKHVSHNNTETYIESPNSDIIKNTKFDNIKPSQVSYFSTYSMRNLCNKANLYIHNVSNIGDNAIYKIGIMDNIYSNVTDVIINELDHELYNIETYMKFTIKYLIIRNTIRNLLLYFYLLELN
jgi:hypothetical protein